MSKYRILSALLALLVVFSLTACTPASSPTPSAGQPEGGAQPAGQESPTGAAEPGNQDFYQVEMFNTYANYMGVQGGWFGHILKDKFNMELNIIAPNVAGTGDALYQTRSAAGNLGDIIVQSKSRMVDCYKAGLLMDMAPYLETAQHLQKLQLGIDSCKELIGGDGVYAIPGRISTSPITEPAGRGLNPEAACFLRWDWYEEAGAPEIKDLDGLVDVLASIVEAHPTNEKGDKVYAFSLFKDWDGDSVRASRELLFLQGLGGGQGYYWMNYDGSKIVDLTEDSGPYYEGLRILNKAYNLGIVDPDSSTQNYDMCQAKFKDGRILFSWWPWMCGTIHDRYDMTNAEAIPYAMVPITNSVVNNVGYNPYGLEGNAFAIGSGAKYPERLVQFLDWYASPEGVLYSNGHIEGLTYEMVDGKPKLTEFGKNATANKYEAPEELGGGLWSEGGCQINYPLIHADDVNEILGEPTNSNLWTTTIQENSNPFNTRWTEIYSAASPLEYLKTHNMLEVTPGTSYSTPSEPSDITTMRAQIKDLFTAAGWKMIYAQSQGEFELIWKDMKAQLPDFGIDEVLEYDMNICKEIAAARQEALAQ